MHEQPAQQAYVLDEQEACSTLHAPAFEDPKLSAHQTNLLRWCQSLTTADTGSQCNKRKNFTAKEALLSMPNFMHGFGCVAVQQSMHTLLAAEHMMSTLSQA